MSRLNAYGTLWGAIPETTGRVFWISPSATYTLENRTYSASDNNDGLSPERAFLTLEKAVNTEGAAGDVFVLLPGDHTVATTSLAMDSEGMVIMGMPLYANWVRPRTTLTTSITADEIINVTAANCQIANLGIIPITGAAGINFTAAADNLWVHHCFFDMATPAGNASTIGIGAAAASNAVDRLHIDHCYFLAESANGTSPGAAIALSSSFDFVVEDCVMEVQSITWTSAVTTALQPRGLFARNIFKCGASGGMTDGVTGVDTTSNSSVTFVGNVFGSQVTVTIDDFGAADADLAENYKAGSGSGTNPGGALITTIT
jgi:hypothetical protein